MITCEAVYLYPGKQIANFQPFCNCPIDQRKTLWVKGKKYMADTDDFIPGAVAIQSLVCSMVRAMMYKNSYGKVLRHANYG